MISEAILKEFYLVESMNKKPLKLAMGEDIHRALSEEVADDAGIPKQACALTMFRGIIVEKDSSLDKNHFKLEWVTK